MKNHNRLAAAAAAAAILFTGAACSSGDAAESAPKASEDTSKITAAAAADAVEGFFNEATSDEVGSAFPDKADEKTFAAAVDKTDPAAPKDGVAEAITDLAWLKVENPKAKITIAVDESKVKVADKKATVPADAVSIALDGKPAADNAKLAGHLTDVVFKDGEWFVSFPAEAEPTASATPSAEQTKK